MSEFWALEGLFEEESDREASVVSEVAEKRWERCIICGCQPTEDWPLFGKEVHHGCLGCVLGYHGDLPDDCAYEAMVPPTYVASAWKQAAEFVRERSKGETDD